MDEYAHKKIKLSEDACVIENCPASDDDRDAIIPVSSQSDLDQLPPAEQEDVCTETESAPLSDDNCTDVVLSIDDATTQAVSSLRETDVGITEYATHCEPIGGILKQRYSDFVVHEVALSGNIVKLTSTENIDLRDASTGEPAKDNVSSYLPDEDLERVNELASSNDPSASIKVKASDDKAKRTATHAYIRLHFPELRSSCIEVGGSKYLIIAKHTAAGGDARNARDAWPKKGLDYVHFVLYKEFKDTMEAIDIISKYTGIKPSAFTYAGTKDKRAKTTQQAAVYRVQASKLCRVNAKLQNMVMGNFSYRKDPLQLGDLKGNHFALVLRNVVASEAKVSQAMEGLRDHGFVNYYGMQRFGTSAIATHEVGRKLLQGSYAAAVELILGEREGERSAVAAARRIWARTRDAHATFRALPRCCHIERRLTEGMAYHGCSGKSADFVDNSPQAQNRWLRALERVPRGSRLMYVHSYQSYVWNTVASRRLRALGPKPVVGDLVVMKPSSDTSKSPEHMSGGRDKGLVTLLKQEEDIKNYSIYDVCLPLPGYDVTYPSHEAKDWYREILEKDSMNFDSFRTKAKDYSLSGSYRKLMVKPENVTWELCHYDDASIPLILSDSDILTGVSLPDSPSNGRYAALKVEFSLPSSSYATMALREVMRTDTSSAHQTTLNNPS